GAQYAEELELPRAAPAIGLRRIRAPLERIAHASPRLWRQRCEKSTRAGRWSSIGNAFERAHALDDFAEDLSGAKRYRPRNGRAGRIGTNRARDERAQAGRAGDRGAVRKESATLQIHVGSVFHESP